MDEGKIDRSQLKTVSAITCARDGFANPLSTRSNIHQEETESDGTEIIG
jgi:hypothetical protein